ncbi:hypothetical protein V9T40_008942 [Parthenolecanium corni]|uniref:Uncharacterized protein n=1 Tax=Parthenolecanium corni TaxID=536013 RepID=A0AAN9TRE0_9HEMI
MVENKNGLTVDKILIFRIIFSFFAHRDGCLSYKAFAALIRAEVINTMHLENSQRVYFNESNVVQRAASPPATTLTSFFLICQSDTFAQNLLYAEMPRYYTWNASTKKFQRQKQGNMVPGYPDIRSTDALGRIYSVHPKSDECFYLRLLLVNVRGPTSFVSLRTVNGVVCPTFCAACQELHLLENDSHWDITIAEAVISASPNQIRTSFAIIIEPTNIEGLALRFVYGHCKGKTNWKLDLYSDGISVGIIGILGIRTSSPSNLPLSILA